ncbi:MAG: aldose 1-epimerase family protein [Clostridia bacterium]|nr:aldose 1-epimerase family protein [Clostridia bacterium]
MRCLVTGAAATLEVDSRGAEMRSIRDREGVEYLWQADPAIWPETSPILFPWVGRLWNGGFRHRGRFFALPQHGFAASGEFSLAEESEGKLVLRLASDERTREMYPFDFAFTVTYEWIGRSLRIVYRVENHGTERMFFGLGGHPGFRVPLSDGEDFEDYVLEFSDPARPCRVGFTEDVFLSDRDEPYPLEEERILPLRHGLFDEDAVILKNMARGVTLRSKKSGRGVALSYPDMPYLGIWHWPKTKAEYVCLEPWCSLPARQGVEEEISCKSDLLTLPAWEVLERAWAITLIGERKI